jgi:hypothetical protein
MGGFDIQQTNEHLERGKEARDNKQLAYRRHYLSRVRHSRPRTDRAGVNRHRQHTRNSNPRAQMRFSPVTNTTSELIRAEQARATSHLTQLRISCQLGLSTHQNTYTQKQFECEITYDSPPRRSKTAYDSAT